ncbi:MAG TPA: lysophospholipid acyltransferase family protein [Steroidobacteraceae bacterium]|nr:lysophospholipid acyltransferase family protein [Steroidobacteraceae bacterium]
MRPSAFAFVGLVRLLVGAYARWVGCQPQDIQRLYFANHTSHIDTLALWSALPLALRGRTRPVAARDYWGSGLRRYLATRVLRAVLIDRTRGEPTTDPLEPLIAALRQGDSLILFPEGTRGREAVPGPFRSGLYRLAQQFPTVELIPVYLENLNRAMPKGAFIPIPITCTVRFGAPLAVGAAESREDFLARARAAVIALTDAAA